MATANTREMVGEYNEKGTTLSLFNRGFNLAMALGEFIANSIDADADIINLHYIPPGQKIFDRYNCVISDNGNGMTRDKLKDCASVYGMNHTGEKKIGLAGTGLKTAGASMAKSQIVLSRAKDGDYLALDFPWKKISEQSQYTGNVILREQTPEEIAVFAQNLPGECNKGTVILMDLSKPGEVEDYMNHVANPAHSPNSFNISDLPQVRFGQCDVDINVSTTRDENRKIRMLNPYDFKEEYHYGRKELSISHYTKYTDSTRDPIPLFAAPCIDDPGSIAYFEGDNKVNQNARVMTNTEFERKMKKEKWTKNELNITLLLSRPKFVGNDIKSDWNGSSLNTILNSQVFPDLDEKYTRPLQENMQFTYNNMVIASLPISGNSFRASGNANVARVTTSLGVYAYSDRANPTLQQFGINDNKMLHSGELPKGLTRLAKHLRHEYHMSFRPFSKKLEKKANDSKCKAPKQIRTTDTLQEVKKIENKAATKINKEAVLPNQEQPIIDTQDKCVKPDGSNTKLESKLNASQSNHEGINENHSQGIYASDSTKNNDIPTSICDISEKKHTIVQNEADGLNIEPQGKAENDQLLKEILDKLESRPEVEKQVYEILKRKLNPEDQEETY